MDAVEGKEDGMVREGMVTGSWMAREDWIEAEREECARAALHQIHLNLKTRDKEEIKTIPQSIFSGGNAMR